MGFLDLPGLQYFYNKYVKGLKSHAFRDPANNLTTTASGYALDARQGKALNDKVTQLNSALATRNVCAEDRFNQDANAFYGQVGWVTFFHVNIETATTDNHFPTEGYPGTLMAINIYGAHLIQVFFCMDGYIYMRTLSDYNNPSGSNFSAWRKI